MPSAKHPHGNRGGNWLPKLTPAEQAALFAAAVAEGRVVRARCLCTRWLVTPTTMRQDEMERLCTCCLAPMAADAERAA